MFVTMRRYHARTGTDAAEISRRVQQGLLPILNKQPGFHSYKALDCGNDVIVSISAYEDRSAAEAANHAAASWVKENLAEVIGAAEVTVGDVVLLATRQQANIEAVRRGYDAFQRGDVDGVLAELDPNIEWVTPNGDELPTGGTRRGHAAIAEFFQTLNSFVDIKRFTIRELLANGDTVVALGDSTEVLRATGKTIDTTFAHVFTMKNGKTIKFEERADFGAFAAELRSARATT
jgi:uncharacterized protein